MDAPKIKRGRPKTVFVSDILEYRKNYYQINKDKTKGDIYCSTCDVMHSKSNNSRHLQSKFHLQNLNKSNDKEKSDA